MKFLNSLIFLTFALSFNLLAHYISSIVWIIESRQTDPGYIFVFIATALIILLDIAIIRSFRSTLNKSLLLSPLFMVIMLIFSQLQSEPGWIASLYGLIYIISVLGIIVCSAILFVYRNRK
jgi:hypothetical protein